MQIKIRLHLLLIQIDISVTKNSAIDSKSWGCKEMNILVAIFNWSSKIEGSIQ
jgi:hypothetical protein